MICRIGSVNNIVEGAPETRQKSLQRERMIRVAMAITGFVLIFASLPSLLLSPLLMIPLFTVGMTLTLGGIGTWREFRRDERQLHQKIEEPELSVGEISPGKSPSIKILSRADLHSNNRNNRILPASDSH